MIIQFGRVLDIMIILTFPHFQENPRKSVCGRVMLTWWYAETTSNWKQKELFVIISIDKNSLITTDIDNKLELFINESDNLTHDYSVWKSIGYYDYILDTILNGYTIPFNSTPPFFHSYANIFEFNIGFPKMFINISEI
jgi:hypothetical protein